MGIYGAVGIYCKFTVDGQCISCPDCQFDNWKRLTLKGAGNNGDNNSTVHATKSKQAKFNELPCKRKVQKANRE